MIRCFNSTRAPVKPLQAQGCGGCSMTGHENTAGRTLQPSRPMQRAVDMTGQSHCRLWERLRKVHGSSDGEDRSCCAAVPVRPTCMLA